MAGDVELATAYVRLVPSLLGASKTIERQLGSMDMSGAGRRMGASVSAGLSRALSGAKGWASGITGAQGAVGKLRASLAPLPGAAKSAASALSSMASTGAVRLRDAASSCASALGGMATATAKAGTAAGVAAVASLGLLTKSCVGAYGSYEQLVGGVQTLFGTGGDSLEQYAARVGLSVDAAAGEFAKLEGVQDAMVERAKGAYATAGLSASEYMETATSFAASLVSSLGGDTALAVEYADMAIVDMSDNVNKMGTSMESVQYAYQGFAKQNYTMLDNLKLGYGGTASEMARLINDSGVLGDTMVATADNVNQIGFDKMVEAIHVVQTNMNITGTTAKEAAQTIEGSVASMSAAWTNFQVALADPQGWDVSAQAEQLAQSLYTVIDNVAPRVLNVFASLSQVVSEQLPALLAGVSEHLAPLLPQLQALLTSLLVAVAEFLPQVVTALAEWLPSLVESVAQVFSALLEAMAQAWPQIVESVSAALPQIVETAVEFLTSAVPTLVEMGIQLFVALVQAMPEIVSTICAALPEIIDSSVDALLGNIDQIVEAGLELLSALVENMPGIISAIVSRLPEIVTSCVSTFVSHIPDFIDIGFRLLQGLAKGIASAAASVIQSALGVVGGIIDGVKGAFGIHSPSKVFAEIGGYLMEGMDDGISGGVGGVVDTMRGAARQVTRAANVSATVDVGAAGRAVARTSAGRDVTYNVTIDGSALAGDASLLEALRTVAAAAERRRAQGVYAYGF